MVSAGDSTKMEAFLQGSGRALKASRTISPMARWASGLRCMRVKASLAQSMALEGGTLWGCSGVAMPAL